MKVKLTRMRWAAVVAGSLILLGCGSGGSTESGSNAPVQDVTISSSFQPAVKAIAANSGIVEVAAEIFTAPKSLGLVVGSVFVFDKVAYKVTAVSEESTDRNRLFTTAPTLDETYSELSIVGTVPLSGGTIEMAAPNNSPLKSRSGNLISSAEPRAVAASVSAPECSIPSDKPWKSTEELVGDSLWVGTSGGIECKVNDAVTVSGNLGITGLVHIDYRKGRPAAQNIFKITTRVTPTVKFAFEKAFGKDWRKNIATLRLPIAATAGVVEVAVPIDFIAGASATVKGQATVSALGQIEATFTAEPKATATVYGLASSDLSGSLDLSGYVGLSPGVGLSIVGIDIFSFQVDGKIIAEMNGETDLTKACSNMAIKAGAGLSFKRSWDGDPISLYEADSKTLWTQGGKAQCLSFPKINVQANGNPLTGAGSTSVPNTPFNGAFVRSTITQVNQSAAALGALATPDEEEAVSTSANLSVASSMLYGATIAAVKWEVVGGDMPLTFTQPTASTTSVGASTAVGTSAQVRVSVTSSSDQVATKTFTVERNKLPVAVGKIALNGDQLSLDASGSYDPNGQSIRSYRWILTDGSVITTKLPVVSVNAGTLTRPISARLLVWSSGSFREKSEIVQVALADSSAVGIIEQGIYGAPQLLADCSGAACTHYYWKVKGTQGKFVDDDYTLSGSTWVKRTPQENTQDWNLTSAGWVADGSCPIGQTDTYRADGAHAVVNLCDGSSIKVSASTVDASGKTLAALGLNPPSTYANITMPSGSYLHRLTLLGSQDRYYLYTGQKVSKWVYDSQTQATSQVPFTSINDFIAAYPTGNTYTGRSGLCFSFDAGGTSTGGNLTLWSCDPTGQGMSSIVGNSTYERRTVSGKELLIIKAQAPESQTGDLVMYAVKDGYLYGGTHSPATSTPAPETAFNKVMMEAILKARGLPAVVD